MARVTIEDCLEQIENRFALVHVAALRTRQLLEGAQPLVHHPRNKQTTLALREVADRQIAMDDRHEAKPRVAGRQRRGPRRAR